MVDPYTVYRVYYAGDDNYIFYKGFASKEEAIETAKSLRTHNTFGLGSVIVIKEETVYVG